MGGEARGPKPIVAIGFLGTTLDAGVGPRRWGRWRPTVGLCSQPSLPVARLVLLRTGQQAPALSAVIEGDVRHVSPHTAVEHVDLALADPWDFEEVFGALHDFARSYPFDTDREEYLVHLTTGTHVAQICLFLLTEARYVPARLAQTSPPRAPPVEVRPSEPPSMAGTCSLIDLDLARYDRIAQRFRSEREARHAVLKGGIATRDPRFNALIERIERVAVSSPAPILLLGPTGAGKSQLARQIYELRRARRRLSGPLVEVNCATLRGDGAMSALFGHVRGAFTGAVEARAGLLREAHGGMLFLDEIGELGRDEQAMLLRAIEDKTFLPVGSDRPVSSEFQLVAGTNRPLGELAVQGAFRADLLARIDLWTFRLPGLAERPDDLAPNLDHELDRVGASLGTRVTMSREARARYLAFGTSPEALWVGNFRDLVASVTRMATLADGGRITLLDVDEELDRLRQAWAPTRAAALTAPERGPVAPAHALLGARAAEFDPFDLAQLDEVLRTCRASRSLSEAGRRLFAVSRTAKTSTNDADRLRKYLARFGLAWADVAGPG
jgi:transcriptional regulatory protein RtcR